MLPSCRRANRVRARARSLIRLPGFNATTWNTVVWRWQRRRLRAASTSFRACTHFKKKDLEFSQTLKYVAFVSSESDLLFHI